MSAQLFLPLPGLLSHREARRRQIMDLWINTSLTADQIAEKVHLSDGRKVRQHLKYLRDQGEERAVKRPPGPRQRHAA